MYANNNICMYNINKLIKLMHLNYIIVYKL